jgi:thiol-disulfide isomerase/thioredoxin
MHRLLIGTCVLALAVVAVRAADDTKPIGETYKALFGELVKKYQATKSEKEKDQLVASYAEKFLELAKKNPKDGMVVDILSQVIALPYPDSKGGPRSQAAIILKKDHLKSEKLPKLLGNLGGTTNEDCVTLIKAVLDGSTDKKTRTAAITAYMEALGTVIGKVEDAKRVEAAREDMNKARKILKDEFPGIKDLFVGATMPELKSKGLDDKETKLSELKGRVVVLDIWATWCPPCREMIPHEREMVKKLKGKPFVLVSISADDKKETLTKFLETNEMPWTHWWEGRGPLLTQLDIRFFPTIYVLDGKGVIRYKGVRGEAMEKAVETLLKEMEDKTKSGT